MRVYERLRKLHKRKADYARLRRGKKKSEPTYRRLVWDMITQLRSEMNADRRAAR